MELHPDRFVYHVRIDFRDPELERLAEEVGRLADVDKRLVETLDGAVVHLMVWPVAAVDAHDRCFVAVRG